MTTVELKNILIHKISAINDIPFLNAIKIIVDSKSESMVYMTSKVQQKSIIEGREQIARGEFFTNEQIELEIDQWLKEE